MWPTSNQLKKFQTCTALTDRVDYVGHYNSHECEIRLQRFTDEDIGQWSCEMESYILGPARGSTDKKVIDVQVEIEVHIETDEGILYESKICLLFFIDSVPYFS